MKIFIHKILIISLAIFLAAPSLKAQMVSQQEASTVARNWIRLIIEKKGNWGGAPFAKIKAIAPFQRQDGQVLGYFCTIEPSGFIIVSLNQALAPIKAYSVTDQLDPRSEAGPTDLIKDQMEGLLIKIRLTIGKTEIAKTENLEKLLGISYRSAWQELEDDSRSFAAVNYQGGDVMLATHWEQTPPYNDQCPSMDCDYESLHGRAYVGCTATAGSQLARYWSWPPYGEDESPFTDPYDWPSMVNEYLWDDVKKFWKDETGALLTQTQVDAVAELCAEMGEAVDMHYDCDGSGAPICRSLDTDMRDALGDHFHYYTGDCEDRDDYSAVDWFELLKNEFNHNRPVLYHVTEHSIVADGWQEVGSQPLRQYHMNYGWGEGDDIWYTLDTLPLGDEDEEYALLGIVPVTCMGSTFDGKYALESFPYRYFNEDASGENAAFAAGQYLQILPGITITCKTGTVAFSSSTSASTYLFLNGDLAYGIHLKSGAIKLYKNGSISFPKKN